jgi:uncharacterized tellurite resistance protein B-like protein
MIDLVKRFFGRTGEGSSKGSGKEAVHDVRMATCALLLEMADIDGEFDDSEQDRILEMLKKDYGLSDENAAALMEAAKEELERSIDLWRFSRLINENYTEEEKIRIIEMLWRIVYTDGNLDKHENYLVHKLSSLLHLTHKDLIDAKLKVLHGRGPEG